MNDWTLVIHGGAGIFERGKIAPEVEAAARDGLAQALEAGSAMLREGGAALDAVEAAVCVLEDHPAFNAGRGSVFTYEGRNEMDAAIMDGRDRSAGAVAGVIATRNPVRLARAVMEQSPHVMLAGKGADAFSRDHGLEQADADWFGLPERRAQLEAMKASGGDAFDVDMKYGTVGAVARDAHGHVAAATSTGGVTGKRWGRVGDSPILGAGTWADDRACAVSCTGAGEVFLRVGVAHEIAAHIRFADENPQAAADTVMAEVTALGGTGGVIVVGADGTPAWSLTTAGMFRGRAGSAAEPQIAIFGDEG